MATEIVKAAGRELSPHEKKVADVRGLLGRVKSQIALALPRHMNADRLLRITMTSVQKTPKLLECDPMSLVAAVIQSAQLGLEPDGALGMAYLVPFKGKVTFIPGYRGLVDLARRSGQLSTISAHVVYERDTFSYSLGTDERINHVRNDDAADPGKPTHAYAVAKLRDGGIQMAVMSRREIEAIRAKSPGGNSGPWVEYPAEMWKKTVIRRLAKLLPMSVEMSTAVQLDEQAEAGLPQDFNGVIDGTVDEPAVDPAPATDTTGGAQ